MDPPPLPPHPTATTTATATTITPPAPTISATSIHLNYPDSVESSPRSRLDPATNDDPLPQVPGAKLRLMCSYGGHIIPRPHDKSLCYVGGETRLVVVDRHSSLSSFCTRLSRSLLNGRPFTLKFQLPNEDLDSLVSVTTDEDLENLIEEYERLTSSSSSSSLSHIRLFIFFNKPETAATMGSLLDDAKSETWFVDALNGAGFIPRGLSDTNVDQLLNLDNEMTDLNNHVQEPPQNDTQETAVKNSNTTNTTTTASYHHDAQYPMPDSPMVESHSSFGSSSSSPSTSNLPPIRVRVVEDQRSTMEEQFAQMGFAPVAPPQVPVNVVVSGDQNSTNSRVVSDDERSDHGGNVVGSRKPPLPLQLQQPLQHNINSKAGAAVYSNLPSPDSVASDSSITSANSLSKPTHQHHQEQQLLTAPTNRTNPAPPIPNTNTDQIPISNRTPQFTQDPSFYALPPQLDHHHPPPPQQPPQQPPPQQQYMHPSMHYIPHPASTPVPVPSYYQIYAPSPQPNQQPPHHHPVYVMPVTQAPPSSYMSMQPNMVDNANNAATSFRPPTPPTPAIVTAATTATSAGTPPVYPAKGTTTVAANSTSTTTTTQGGNNKPDQVTAAAVEYRTAAASAPPQMVQVPANQFQQQYVNYAHLQPPPHPSVAMAAPPGINNANNYGNYDHQHQHQHQHHQYHDHHQLYYTQHQAAAVPLPPQYQSMTPAAAAAALAEASAESANQQIRTQQKI